MAKRNAKTSNPSPKSLPVKAMAGKHDGVAKSVPDRKSRKLPTIEGIVETDAGQTIVEIKSHSGPIPSPEYLEKYGKILPSCPERILTMAEREQSQKHRHIRQPSE